MLCCEGLHSVISVLLAECEPMAKAGTSCPEARPNFADFGLQGPPSENSVIIKRHVACWELKSGSIWNLCLRVPDKMPKLEEATLKTICYIHSSFPVPTPDVCQLEFPPVPFGLLLPVS